MGDAKGLPTPNGYPFNIDLQRQWLVAFIVCNFNVDLGPEIEFAYPETSFSTSDLTAICFNSFPERQETDGIEDLFFHFKMRNGSPDIRLQSPHEPHGSAEHFYGYCLFHQKVDMLSKRKYEQKTLVLITNHPFPAFYIKILQLLAPSFMIDSIPALEAACTQIANWSAPTPGDQQLPFLGSVIDLHIAAHPSFPLQGISRKNEVDAIMNIRPQVYAYAPETSWDTLVHYLPSISELYVIFEKLLLCEPLIFLSNSPQLCSEFVSAAIDLIRPLPYIGDWRPYLTMQSTFCTSSTTGGIPPRFVIGVTNPFLVSRIISMAEASGSPTTPHVVQINSNKPVPIKPPKTSIIRRRSQSKTTFSDLPAAQQSNATVRPATALAKDYTFLNQVQSLTTATTTTTTSPPPQKPNPYPIDALIRRHFATLTASFLSPLTRSLTTTQTTPQKDNQAPQNPERPTSFSLPALLTSIATHGAPGLPFKGRTAASRARARDAFYTAFCAAPGLEAWMNGGR